MIPIANPLADKELAQKILECTKSAYESKALISGIKACQKCILESPVDKLLVLSATTTPMDLITHLPILCEDRGIPYVFVENSSWISDFTCVMLGVTEDGKGIEKAMLPANK